jgi:uncharacterized zinc-type alcohol dehydrogenase-like protein
VRVEVAVAGDLEHQRRELLGLAETQEMLDFCAEKGIVPDIETIAMETVNHAYDRMEASDVKYRFVIDMATL